MEPGDWVPDRYSGVRRELHPWGYGGRGSGVTRRVRGRATDLSGPSLHPGPSETGDGPSAPSRVTQGTARPPDASRLAPPPAPAQAPPVEVLTRLRPRTGRPDVRPTLRRVAPALVLPEVSRPDVALRDAALAVPSVADVVLLADVGPVARETRVEADRATVVRPREGVALTADPAPPGALDRPGGPGLAPWPSTVPLQLPDRGPLRPRGALDDPKGLTESRAAPRGTGSRGPKRGCESEGAPTGPGPG